MSVDRMWVKTVGPKHRVRLHESIVSALPWLTPGKARDCWASIGSRGQLVISPEPPVADEIKKILDQEFETNPGRVNEASEEESSLLRFTASTWPISLQGETGRQRMSFVLPKKTRELGIAPSEREPVVLCVIDNMLEVWKTENWVEHARRTRRDLDSIQERVSDEWGLILGGTTDL